MGRPGLRAFAAAASRGAQSLLGIEPGRRTGHDVCRILLGSVLLTAAALKAHQALTEPADGGGFFDSHGLALAIVEFEVLLGVAMLSGLFRRFTWAVSALCFAGFACASLWKGLSNAPSCGCFGAVPVNPWYTFALDVAAVCALLRWRPGVASNAPYRMHAQWLRLLGAGCAALFVAVVWWWFRTAGAIAANQGLAVAPAALDLGEIWVQGVLPWELPVENRSDKTVEVEDVRNSCDCLSVEPKSFALAPGEVQTLRLAIDLRPKTQQEMQMATRDFAVQVSPVIRGSAEPSPGWKVRGIARKPCELSEHSLVFGETWEPGSQFEEKTIKVRSLVRARQWLAVCEEAKAAVRITPLEHSRWDYEVGVRPSAGLANGDHRFTISLFPEEEAGAGLPGDLRARPRADVEVRARIHGSVRALPEHLLLGAGPLGGTLEGSVTLSSTGRPFRVCEVRCFAKGMSASPVDSPARSEFGTVRTYRVSQRIVECGMREEKVSFACAREDGVAEVVFVNVSYQGAEAAALAGN